MMNEEFRDAFLFLGIALTLALNMPIPESLIPVTRAISIVVIFAGVLLAIISFFLGWNKK